MTKRNQSIYLHFIELKKRILISAAAFLVASLFSYIFASQIYEFLTRPLSSIIPDHTSHRIIYTSLTEVFFTYVKLACFSGFIISFPIMMTQLYLFIAPALYQNEKKIFIPFMIASPLLFLFGAVFVYSVIFPLAWKFFLSFENTDNTANIPIILEAKVSEYLSLVLNLIIAFGLSFQIPVILVLLGIFNLIDSNWLKQKRKISIVTIFVIAAILTPPDVVSQVALAIPMLILYELSIYACKYIEHQRKQNNA